MSVDITLRLVDIQDLINLGQGGNPLAIDESMLDSEFDDIGVDSLALVELVDRIQETCRLRIDDDVVQTLRTPRRLLDFVNARLDNRDT